MMATHLDDKVDHVCDVCGIEWITRGEPSEEGTICCVQRCYCHVDCSMASLDEVIRKIGLDE